MENIELSPFQTDNTDGGKLSNIKPGLIIQNVISTNVTFLP